MAHNANNISAGQIPSPPHPTLSKTLALYNKDRSRSVLVDITASEEAKNKNEKTLADIKNDMRRLGFAGALSAMPGYKIMHHPASHHPYIILGTDNSHVGILCGNNNGIIVRVWKGRFALLEAFPVTIKVEPAWNSIFKGHVDDDFAKRDLLAVSQYNFLRYAVSKPFGRALNKPDPAQLAYGLKKIMTSQDQQWWPDRSRSDDIYRFPEERPAFGPDGATRHITMSPTTSSVIEGNKQVTVNNAGVSQETRHAPEISGSGDGDFEVSLHNNDADVEEFPGDHESILENVSVNTEEVLEDIDMLVDHSSNPLQPATPITTGTNPGDDGPQDDQLQDSPNENSEVQSVLERVRDYVGTEILDLLPDVYSLERYSELEAGSRTDWWPFSFRVGTMTSKDTELECCVYLKCHQNPNFAPSFRLQAFNKGICVKRPRVMKDALKNASSFTLFVSSFQMVEPFNYMVDKEHFKALIRYYFALADEEDIPTHQLPNPGINAKYMNNLLGACNKIAGLRHPELARPIPPLPAPPSADQDTSLTDDDAAEPDHSPLSQPSSDDDNAPALPGRFRHPYGLRGSLVKHRYLTKYFDDKNDRVPRSTPTHTGNRKSGGRKSFPVPGPLSNDPSPTAVPPTVLSLRRREYSQSNVSPSSAPLSSQNTNLAVPLSRHPGREEIEAAFRAVQQRQNDIQRLYQEMIPFQKESHDLLEILHDYTQKGLHRQAMAVHGHLLQVDAEIKQRTDEINQLSKAKNEKYDFIAIQFGWK
ncbi:hypothetical protein P280DRAFT_471145 [Massarina eburnea CBS 473.64]|uniref:Uncharacterized protein n=1 Tax=Massarina eburnea CBS 473.64 TaxID=1395130 RepID=A0A6A6RVV3_9PLEO|nr:hypothetical protein P280DRAFT_471145 [Massarina eburnea CBS 473.64]